MAVMGCKLLKKYLVPGSHCGRAIKVQGKRQRAGEINVPDRCVCLCFPTIRNSWPYFIGFSQERKALHNRLVILRFYV